MARTSGSKTREYPVHTLEQTLVIIQAIADKGAGRAMDRLLVADGMPHTIQQRIQKTSEFVPTLWTHYRD